MTAALPTHIRPSNLPALSQCPCFEPSASDFAEAGTDRHAALRAHFESNDGLLELLPEEDAEGVRWAAEYIRMKAPLSDHPIGFEQPLSLILDDFSEINGTLDATCHLDLFDLKWRERDYRAQLAAYVLMRLQELGIDATITVHVLYAAFRRAEVFHLDATSARAIVLPILDRARDPDRQSNPCTYCSWCARQLTCPALNIRAQAVAAGREDWQLQSYHCSEITDPRQMSRALTLAKHLAKWCKAVEHHALDMVIKRGEQIPGYTLKSRAGKRSCHDLTGAFNSLGLPVETFLACCDIRFSTSKENPDKKGIEDVYSAAHGVKKAAAKRELSRKLQPFLRTPKDNPYLAPETQEEEEITYE
jgi:hypothetical protein